MKLDEILSAAGKYKKRTRVGRGSGSGKGKTAGRGAKGYHSRAGSGKDLGFEGSWIFTGARPPQKTLEQIEDSAQDSSAILLHHRTEPEVREEVLKMAAEMEIPLREAPWIGVHGIEGEVLRTIRDCVAEDEAASESEA